MTELIELLCLGLAGWAAKLSLYRPPQFDWKESFSFSLNRVFSQDHVSLYPPCLGGSWDQFDVVMTQERHRVSLSHTVLFSFDSEGKPHHIVEKLSGYLEKKNHVVSPEADKIAEQITQGAQRLLFFCVGTQVQEVLKLLKNHPGMRDVLYAFVALDPVFDEEWMNENFGQDTLDAEANSPIPYIFCFSKEERSIPEPKESTTGWRSMRSLSLGVLRDTEHPDLSMAFCALMSALYS
jgi:hypothetical protein